jgi:poly(3-hydroxybutyrate) depolymerase
MANRGSAVDSQTGRTYFLDYPCDLKKGDKVTFILSLHGAGSSGQWQRHYFPLLDYKDKYKLVIATPTAATAQPTRTWQSGPDDGHLQNIVTAITEQLGKDNIKAFWLVGHSQGGLTSTRLVCTDFFKARADGFLSLSGGRIGGSAGRSSNFQNLAPRGGAPTGGRGSVPDGRGAPAAGGAGTGGQQTTAATTCDYSHIFTTGEHEIVELPKTSSWAQKYQCDAAPKQSEVVDTKAGYVYDGGRQNPGSKGWGLLARPGKAEVFVYQGCKDGRVVADVRRMDKGHTEGLEPRVTEELVKLLTSARGGKIQKMQ